MLPALKLEVSFFIGAGNSVMQTAPSMAGQAVDETAGRIFPSLHAPRTEGIGAAAGAVIAIIACKVGIPC
ncbi:hypothetical protein ES703_52173 [subsurface metagenome]